MDKKLFIIIFTIFIIINLIQCIPYNNNYQLPYGDVMNNRFYREIQNILAKKQELKPTVTEISKVRTPSEVINWPKTPLYVGQISGVSVNNKNQPVIFHRADRIWNIDTFDLENNYLHRDKGPIHEDTILTLDPDTGEIIDSWGANLFFLPHGITVDHHDNVWVTDVALHQVFKFKPHNVKPHLELGEPFSPGTSYRHFCKPTSVAIASTGEIFIADGYCNSRVLKFNAAGGLLRIIPNPPEYLSLFVPHGLALIESLDRICIADRENMRVVCTRAGLYVTENDLISNSNTQEQNTALIINEPDMGRIFDITAIGETIYAVNGPSNRNIDLQGFTIDPKTETVIDHWGPISGKLQFPHAITVDRNKTAIYISEISPIRLWKFSL